MGTYDDDRTHETQRFPGGPPRLPRLARPRPGILPEDDESTDRAQQRTGPEPEGRFTDYFSNESLFGATHPVEDDNAPSDAYSVLGITRHASWKEVSLAHRQLVSKLHPDRFVGADDETRAAAERKVRDVNEAFAEIRRLRAPTHC